jgi:outer membrane protein TolC
MKLSSLALALLLVLGSGGRAISDESAIPSELTLPQCLNLALAHNPQMRIASEQFLSAEGKSIKLHAILYPTVDAQALTTPLTFYVQIQETFYSRATLPSIRLSRLTREQAFLNYRQTLTDVVYQVRQVFTTGLGAQKLADLNRQLIEQRDAAVKTAQHLFDAGKAQRSDVLPLQVLARLARQNDALADLSRQQAALALTTVLGIDLPASVRFKGNLPKDSGADLNSGQLSAEALRDRVDLKLLENARLSATQQVEIDQKNAWPIVGFESDSAIQPPAVLPGSVGYDLNRNFDEPQTERQPGNTQLPLSLYVNWMIFDGGNLAGLKASEQAQIASQAVAIDALKRSIPGEVASAVATILSERDTLRLLDAQAPSADVRQEAETDYQAGRVRLLDKINLDTDIVRQQQLRLESQVRLSLALAALDHALGRGLEAPLKASPLSSP